MRNSLPKIVIFDLDGTLSVSKQKIDPEMADLLAQLLSKTKVAVISGGKFERFIEQVVEPLKDQPELFNNLFLFPTSGGSFFRYTQAKFGPKWEVVYQKLIPLSERERIIAAFKTALEETRFPEPEELWGEQLEVRETQVTFSALGQQAPIEEKSKWDPHMTKRAKIIAVLQKLLPEYNVAMGGTTSIDVTQKGIDKGFAIPKITEYLGIPVADMLFVGDKLIPGGNDYPVVRTGIEVHAVGDVPDTKLFIRELLNRDFSAKTSA